MRLSLGKYLLACANAKMRRISGLLNTKSNTNISKNVPDWHSIVVLLKFKAILLRKYKTLVVDAVEAQVTVDFQRFLVVQLSCIEVYNQN